MCATHFKAIKRCIVSFLFLYNYIKKKKKERKIARYFQTSFVDSLYQHPNNLIFEQSTNISPIRSENDKSHAFSLLLTRLRQIVTHMADLQKLFISGDSDSSRFRDSGTRYTRSIGT